MFSPGVGVSHDFHGPSSPADFGRDCINGVFGSTGSLGLAGTAVSSVFLTCCVASSANSSLSSSCLGAEEAGHDVP